MARRLGFPRSLKSRLFCFIAGVMVLTTTGTVWFVHDRLSRRLIEMQVEKSRDILFLGNRMIENYFGQLVDLQIKLVEEQKSKIRSIGELVAESMRVAAVPAKAEARLAAMRAWLSSISGERGLHAFAYDLDLTGVSHPDPAMVGKSWGEFRDILGKNALAYMRDEAVRRGQAFDSFTWKGAGEEPTKHIASFHYVPRFSLVVGVAVDVTRLQQALDDAKNVLIRNLAEILTQIDKNSPGYLFVFDQSGAIIYHPHFQAGRMSSDRDWNQGRTIQEILVEFSRTGALASYRGISPERPGELVQKVAVTDYVPALGWYLSYAVTKEALYAPITRMTRDLVAIAALVFILAAISYFVAIRAALRPIERLAQASKELGSRGFDRDGAMGAGLLQMEPASTVEVESLRLAIVELLGSLDRACGNLRSAIDHKTRLARELADSNKELSELNRDLESRVALRTKEYARVNAELAGKVQELEQTRGSLRRAMVAADSANRAKSEFLANMSHEIRTPLTAVLGVLQVLAKTDLDATQRQFLDEGVASAKSLLQIIGDILDLSKIEADRLDIVSAEFDPAETIESVVAALRATAERKGVAIAAEVDPSLPARVAADETRLRQILFNLVGNSVKFTEAGGVRVHVSAEDVPGQDGKVRLRFTVADTGIGIPAAKRQAIFEPFVQADGSYTRTYQGTGLGLAIVKRLVGLMGGTVRLASEEGRGTEIDFDILASRVNVVRGVAGDPVTQPTAARIRGRLRILYAEDDRINHLALKMLMTMEGYLVTDAYDGREVLDLLGRVEFDCLLMDVQMPAMDGVEATRRIRAGEAGSAAKDVPIVALTAHALAGDREKFLAAGMDGYLTKPVDMVELARAVRQAIEAKAAASCAG